MLLVGCAAPPASHSAISTPSVAGLTTGEQWKAYLQDDLLPFWMHPEALGEPVGNFPSTRCNDGSRLDRTNPCPEIKDNGWLMQDLNYVVSMSRQTYGYGVAFHLTGERKYLALMKAGVTYLRENAFDRNNGGVFAMWNGERKQWEPEPQDRNPQELAYALLGVSFYYYLTRDPDVLPDILSAQANIWRNHYSADLNALQWLGKTNTRAEAQDKKLTAQLDQLNAYMILVAPLLPEAERAKWQKDLRALVEIMRTQFYSPDDNLFFLRANTPAEVNTKNAETDFGHTIKALWMTRFVGLQLGDEEMVRFAEDAGLRVLQRAFIADTGSWARGVKQGGAIDASKEWWIYNELDQFAATMAMSGAPELAETYLVKTHAFWFTHFVDKEHGEVWTSVQPDGTRNIDMPKAWPWKSAYHSFEHALVGYISAQAIAQQPVTLYFAFDQTPDSTSVQPYFFAGKARGLDIVSSEDGVSVYRARFEGVK
jgi:mannose/cellobiose epimerase-like protein (N-acyl-D-glucosamine 2-epimerase family)